MRTSVNQALTLKNIILKKFKLVLGAKFVEMFLKSIKRRASLALKASSSEQFLVAVKSYDLIDSFTERSMDHGSKTIFISPMEWI